MKIIKGYTLTSEELAELFKTQLEERMLDADKWRGLKFGHPELDEITGGLRKGEFVVVAGAQKAGKTTVALAWAQRFAEQLQPEELVLYVSLEMSHEAIAGRVLANLSDIDVSKFRDYTIDKQDENKLDTGLEKLKSLPVLWNVGAYNIAGIEAIVEEYSSKIRVVVVDYFQLMLGENTSSSKRYEQLEDISLRLKRLTLNYNLSVVALSQQSREALKSIERQKDPNTLAGTQSLVRDCDLLLLILPYLDDADEEVPYLRKLYIALSRNSIADVTMEAAFSGTYCRFGAPTNEEINTMPEPKETWWNK